MQLPRDRAGFMHFIAILKQGTSTNMIVRIWTDLENIAKGTTDPGVDCFDQ